MWPRASNHRNLKDIRLTSSDVNATRTTENPHTMTSADTVHWEELKIRLEIRYVLLWIIIIIIDCQQWPGITDARKLPLRVADRTITQFSIMRIYDHFYCVWRTNKPDHYNYKMAKWVMLLKCVSSPNELWHTMRLSENKEEYRRPSYPGYKH